MVRGSALSNMMHQNAEPKFALSELDVFKDLNAEEYRLVETIVNPLIFEKREVIIREGDQAKLFFVARGRVSVQVRIPTQTGEKRRRVASIGPGLTFGEMALFGGGARSADVVADQKLICYGFAVEQLKELAAVHHDDDPFQSDVRFLRALAPPQRGDPIARVTSQRNGFQCRSLRTAGNLGRIQRRRVGRRNRPCPRTQRPSLQTQRRRSRNRWQRRWQMPGSRSQPRHR